MKQALQGHPANRPVLVIPQAVVIHGKQVSCKGVVSNLHLHVIINTVKRGYEVNVSRKNSGSGGCESAVTTLWTMGLGWADLHTVPGSEVFVYDLPAGQVAHSTSNLNGHGNQVLLRDRLKDKKTESALQNPESIKRRSSKSEVNSPISPLVRYTTHSLADSWSLSFSASHLWVVGLR